MGKMKDEVPMISISETQEILEAACSALDYALDHAQSLRRGERQAAQVPDELIQGLRAAMAAQSGRDSQNALRGHVGNSLAHLRGALKAMQDLSSENEFLPPTMRATARALSLLYPLTQTEEPLLLVPRKKRAQSRRKPPFVSDRAAKRPPLFEVELGAETETNFFAGFEGDVSSGGLFIATYDIHPIGTPLTVKAKLPGGRILADEATVKWVREYNDSSPDIAPGMGVTFDGLDSGDHKNIAHYMTTREAIFYEAV